IARRRCYRRFLVALYNRFASYFGRGCRYRLMRVVLVSIGGLMRRTSTGLRYLSFSLMRIGMIRAGFTMDVVSVRCFGGLDRRSVFGFRTFERLRAHRIAAAVLAARPAPASATARA